MEMFIKHGMGWPVTFLCFFPLCMRWDIVVWLSLWIFILLYLDILNVRSVCCESSTEEAPMFAEINYPDLYVCKDERYRVKLPLNERVASFLKGRLNPLNIKLFKLHAVAIVDSTYIVIRPIGCYQPDERWRMDCKTAAEDFQYGFSQLEVPFPQAARTEAEQIARN